MLPYTYTDRKLTTCLIFPCTVWSNGCVPEPSPCMKYRTPAMQSFSLPPTLSLSISLLCFSLIYLFLCTVSLPLSFCLSLCLVLNLLCFISSPSFAVLFFPPSWLFSSFAISLFFFFYFSPCLSLHVCFVSVSLELSLSLSMGHSNTLETWFHPNQTVGHRAAPHCAI